MIYRRFVCFFFVISFFSFSIFAEDTEPDNKPEQVVSDDFYSIQSSSLTACYGDRWFLEEFNDTGQVILSILYEKDKLIEQRTFFYTDTYKSGVDILSEDKLIKIKYNKDGYEIENALYDKSGTKLIENTTNDYNEDNLLTKTTFKKDEIEKTSIFTYTADKKKLTQTDFVNDEKVCFIEYKPTKKIVHLFQDKKEIKIIEEEF